MREDLISVISFLLDRHNNFICLITGFRAIDYPSPPCANTPLSYIVQNMWTHIQAKAFVGTRGGTICHKTFSYFYLFHCKKHSFCSKVPEAFQKENLFHYHKILNSRKLFWENSNIWWSFIFFQNHRHTHTYDRQSSFWHAHYLTNEILWNVEQQ